MVSARVVGDCTLCLVLASVLIYAALVLAHFYSDRFELKAFGKNWAQDGFCLSFKDSLFHTHLLCFYGDTLLAALIYIICPRKRPELNYILSALPSVVGHGSAHAMLWASPLVWNNSGDEVWLHAGTDPLILQAVLLLGTFTFWYFFLCKIETPFSYNVNILQSLMHTLLLQYFVPPLLAFTYVNTVIFFNLAGKDLLHGLHGKKDKFYALSALTTSLPIMLATWAEPLLCDSYLIDRGGHIIFDYSIPLSYLLYLALASNLEPRPLSTDDIPGTVERTYKKIM